MSKIEKVCSTCRHEPRDEHCLGCTFDWKNADGNTHWEPKEQVCHEGKMAALEKIIEELKEKSYSESEYGVPEFDANRVIQLSDAIEIIDKYRAESEEE